MRHYLLAATAATALALLPGHSRAWDCTQNCNYGTANINHVVNRPTATATGGLGGNGGAGGAGGSAASAAHSYSNSGASVTNNISTASGAAGSSPGSGLHGTIPAASAVAPSFAQFNNCSGSPITGAVQSGIFGLSFGTGNHFDEVCRLHELGLDDVAFAYLCRVDGDVRHAAMAAGHPCPGRAPQRVVVEVPTVPDWCAHLSDPEERAKYRYVCALPGDVRIPGTPVAAPADAVPLHVNLIDVQPTRLR